MVQTATPVGVAANTDIVLQGLLTTNTGLDYTGTGALYRNITTTQISWLNFTSIATGVGQSMFDIGSASLNIGIDNSIFVGLDVGQFTDISVFTQLFGAWFLFSTALDINTAGASLDFLSNGMAEGDGFLSPTNVFDFTNTSASGSFYVVNSNLRMPNNTDRCFEGITAATFNSGYFANNARQATDSGIMLDSVDNSATNWWITGCKGIKNTQVGAAIGIQSNGVSTVLPGVGTWVKADGNTVTASGSYLCSFPSDWAIQYDGDQPRDGHLRAAVSISRAGIITGDDYEITFFRNGVIYTDGGIEWRALNELESGDVQNMTLEVKLTDIVQNDLFELYVRQTTGGLENPTIFHGRMILEIIP